jgi:ech hydrogenase subunit D
MPPMLADCTTVTPEGLTGEVRALHDQGWRLITATCVPRPDRRTVLYHFERGDALRHLRVELTADGSVPSIGAIYPGAFLVENEMQELQGLTVTDLAINYGGRLYRDFDTPEGWVHDEDEAISILEAAGAQRLDACVPVVEGREVRPSSTRVPAAEPTDGGAR